MPKAEVVAAGVAPKADIPGLVAPNALGAAEVAPKPGS